MLINQERFGTDLRLLRNLDLTRSSRDPGNDLSTRLRVQTSQFDLDTLGTAENLVQALLLRFLTPVGELALLGHPDYGSRLFELIGELNSETNRNRAKLYTLQALQAEPRVKEIRSVTVTQSKKDPTQMDIRVSLLPVDSDTLLNLVFPFFLERGTEA
jgi:phage baseplate assembly protein W